MGNTVTQAPGAITSRIHGVLTLGGGVLLVLAVYLWVWLSREAVLETAGQPFATMTQQLAPTGSVAQDSLDTRREQARRYPRDGRVWALLAYAAFEADAYAEAAAAFEKAVTASSKVAADPGVLCDWADALGMAQGGNLRGKPTELVFRALELRSDYPKALEMAGSAAYEERQFPLAAFYWSRLLLQMPQDSAGRQALEEGIARAERLGALPPGKR
jgi:cytochrome c-type biogenesis protein CcmH